MQRPTPRRSAIPTPGRSRSASSAGGAVPVPDVEYMSRAFADAIKANDPALHRTSRISDFSSASLSPQATSFAPRSSSVASSSSFKQPERAKTPTTRPASRQSDPFGRSSSRAGPRAFELGDNVRIESLGFEGVLRFSGSIDGKPGLWAGVELSGGFAGKGKNNGSVSGKQYFSCPPNCGVFVATTKLSAPTVGPGAVSRPSSVASSRGGRTTPSISGRVTPSTSGMSFSTSSRMTPSASRISTGRTTPSNGGRITPSYAGRATPGTTPAARARTRALAKPAAAASPAAALSGKLTAGSRASKYVSMTAKQLSSRDAGTPSRRLEPPASPARSTLPSPSLSSRSTSSPTRPPPSPFSTPKPSLGGRVSAGSSAMGRPSISTPRARIPSAVAMPPPASPVTRSISANEEAVSLSAWTSPRPESASSSRSMLNDQLQSRIQALEYENERLRATSVPPDADQDASAQLSALQLEYEEAQSRASALEAKLAAAEQSLEERAIHIQELEDARTQVLTSLDEEKAQGESRLQTLEQQLEESQLLSATLKEAIAAKESAEREGEGKLKAKQAEIASLELQLKRTQTELDEDRLELNGQVDELRQAGQETIALYEERLSAADRERYDLEARIASLEAGARATERTPSPTAPAKVASSATEIDNETLREQVVHLTKKVAKLEDAIEDAHATSERDEAALADRMRRLKEKEEAMKKELGEGRKEVERMIKSEAIARRRVEEVEEALQESTVALEDARAEVEGLRAELTNLDGLVAGDGESGDLSSRVAEVANRAATDRVRFTEEIAKLQDLLEEARRGESEAAEEVDRLRESLAAQAAEVESLKKKANRDIALNNGIQQPPQSPAVSKHDLSAAKEEITGLKHIVQELQKESLAATQRTKLLESENQLLLSEAEQLRQEVQILEENLDNSLVHETKALEEGPPGDAASLQRLKIKLEAETEQLRKRLADSEMKSARVVHDLNKEISELEALIESKIYREDELEEELERTKDKLARQRKSSKGSSEVSDTRRRPGSIASSEISDTEGVCEICEKPGHDIFSCSLLAAGAPDDAPSSAELFCEDCESHGHVAADCPHSLDVF
ncbi:hypothetical protein C8F04DRAFT_1388040 [Mycena alexandri]|uniref:CAP-Gly domain-containing protein n=1 Tax=Mycena alexandri TaxID=1745969 RepID=A0AAD6XAN5_9AGAR|nr:hypothetical protein C8F04DRAFT_1388040 [Mycena alexandri]